MQGIRIHRKRIVARFFGLLGCALLPMLAHAAVPRAPETDADASRFLAMATFGATPADIAQLSGMRYRDWVDAQLAMPASSHVALGAAYGEYTRDTRIQVWWDTAVNAPDQLRQRVAFALSQIFVVSDASTQLRTQQYALIHYYDLLVANAFGNYRDLLEAVTLSPAMGRYLSMLRNEKPDPVSGRRADENFAREVMQLMSIGLVELRRNGEPKRDDTGAPIPSYTQQDVEHLARALTGWSFGGDATRFDGEADWDDPMAPYDDHHDTDEKRLVGGVTLPAGASARKDLQRALDALANHPNVGPFIGRQLIQRLVTSNPSPGYVRRVARVFDNDGTGTRGNLGAVVRAILLDREALLGQQRNPDFGKPREPLLHITHLWRAFDAEPWLGPGRFHFLHPEDRLLQAPLSAPSVFNFYRPGYQPPGVLADRGLVAPEYQLANDFGVIARHNVLYERIFSGWSGTDNPNKGSILMEWQIERALAADPAALVAHLDVLLTGGSLSAAFREALVGYLDGVDPGSGEKAGLTRTQRAIDLIMTSSFYQFQR